MDFKQSYLKNSKNLHFNFAFLAEENLLSRKIFEVKHAFIKFDK